MFHYPLTHPITPIPIITFPNVPRPLPRPLPLPSKRCHSTLSFDNSVGGKGMKRFHEFELQVRDYELDQFGLVNDSVINNYCEHATHKLMDNIGFDANIVIAVAEISAKYIAPLKKNDKFLLKLRIYNYSICRLYFEDIIVKLPNEEPILKGKCTVVVLDKNHKPCRMSQSMKYKFNQFLMLENHCDRLATPSRKGLELV